MKIKVTEGEKTVFNLSIPTRLGLNSVSATFAPLFLNKKGSGLKVTSSQCRKFVRAFYKCRKHFKNSWNFLEAETAEGEYIIITL